MDPKDFLLRHFEKIIAAGFVAWLAVVGTGPVLFRPKGLDENEQIQKYIDTIEDHMKTFQPHLTPPEDATKVLAKQLEAKEIPDSRPFDLWLCHRRPNLIFSLVTVNPKVVPKHVAPTDFHMTGGPQRGKIAVAWKASVENEHVVVTLCDVYRKDEAGAWKKLDPSVSGDKPEFVDTTVGPRQKYWYKVLEHAEADKSDEAVKKDNVELKAEERDKYSEEIGPIETPQDMYITVDGGEPPDPVTKPGVPGTLDVKVWKWYGKGNDFVSKGYRGIEELQDPPDPKKPEQGKIGKNEPKFQGTALGGTKVTDAVDFTTGALVLAIKKEKRKVRMGKGEIDREVIVAKIKWPWGEEEIVQGEKPAELTPKKP